MSLYVCLRYQFTLNTCQNSWRTSIEWYESCCITRSQQMRVRHSPIWFLKNDPHAQSLSHMKLVARSSSLETLWHKHDESHIDKLQTPFLVYKKMQVQPDSDRQHSKIFQKLSRKHMRKIRHHWSWGKSQFEAVSCQLSWSKPILVWICEGNKALHCTIINSYLIQSYEMMQHASLGLCADCSWMSKFRVTKNSWLRRVFGRQASWCPCLDFRFS